MTELNKILRFKDIFFIGLSDIIGAGLFAIFTSTILYGGTNTIPAFITIAISSMISGLTYSEISSLFKSNISEITLLKEVYSEEYSYFISYIIVFFQLFTIVTIIIALSKYIFNDNRFYGILFSIIIISIIYLINYYGIGLSSFIINIVSLITVICLIFIILYGLSFGNINSNKKMNNFSIKQTGLYGFLISCTFIIFLFSGYDSVCKVYDEIHEDTVEYIPECIVSIIIISTFIYIFIAYLIIKLFKDKDIINEFTVVAQLYKILISNKAYYFAYVIGIFIVIICALTGTLTMSRYVYGLSKDNMLPVYLTQLSKYKTPTNILLLSFIFSIFLAIMDNEKITMNITNIVVFIILISVSSALVIHRYNNKDSTDDDKSYKMPFYFNGVPILPIFNTIFLIILLITCFIIFPEFFLS